ncbi:MAG TPA: xylose isomerase, partial [Treponema sp.]|nr:xylose isomerase [Treponema sp.]
TTQAMLQVIRMGGFTTGGLNFDAKVRRNSIAPEDLFIAHIGGMDIFARGLEKAVQLIEDGRIPSMVKERYASFDSGNGKLFSEGKLTLDQVASLAKPYEQVAKTSGKQELYENILNQICLG